MSQITLSYNRFQNDCLCQSLSILVYVAPDVEKQEIVVLHVH